MMFPMRAVGLLILGAALLVPLDGGAGSIGDDFDADGIPEQFDNCSVIQNGPNTPNQGNQDDTDQDGYGNACDADYNQNFDIDTADFGVFLNAFTETVPDLQTDHNGDGATTTIDFQTFLVQFQNVAPLGPSGLPCAGMIPCQPLTH